MWSRHAWNSPQSMRLVPSARWASISVTLLPLVCACSQQLTPQVSRNGKSPAPCRSARTPAPTRRPVRRRQRAAQLARPRVGLAHFRVGVTARRHEWRAQRQLETKFIMIPRCRFRLEQEQSSARRKCVSASPRAERCAARWPAFSRYRMACSFSPASMYGGQAARAGPRRGRESRAPTRQRRAGDAPLAVTASSSGRWPPARARA